MDLDEVAGILLVMVAVIVAGWVAVRLVGPLTLALAERIRGRHVSAPVPTEELQRLRAEVSELRALLASRKGVEAASQLSPGSPER